MKCTCAFSRVAAIAFTLSVGLLMAGRSQPVPTTTTYLGSHEFRRDILAGQGAPGEIEPRLATVEEKERMREISDMIATNPREAVVALEEYVRDGTNALFDLTLGNLYFQGGDIDRAAARYFQATKKSPSFLRAHKNLGIVLFQKGRNADAIKSLTRAVELGGADGAVLGILGFAYVNAERWLSAESAYRSALLLQPDVPDWKLGLARSLYPQRKFGEVAALMEEMIADAPERTDYWMLQAKAFIGSNQPMKASQNYEMLIRMNRASPEALGLLSDIYVSEKLYGLAARTYVLGMDVMPEEGLSTAVRGAETLAARGAMSAAKEIVAAVRVAGADGLSAEDRKRFLRTEARVTAAQGADDEAAKALHQIVEMDPIDGEALLLLAQYHRRKGEHEKAIFMCERAEGIAAFEADARVRHAQMLLDQGKLDGAVPLLKRAQEILPRDTVGQLLDQVERVVRRGF